MGVSSPCALLQLGRLSLTTSSSVEMDSARPQNGGRGAGSSGGGQHICWQRGEARRLSELCGNGIELDYRLFYSRSFLKEPPPKCGNDRSEMEIGEG